MTITVFGNIIVFFYAAGEGTDNRYPYHLPDGYSLHDFSIKGTNGGVWFPGSNPQLPEAGQDGIIPIVDGKSPCFFDWYVNDPSKAAYIVLTIHKFGGEPWIDYWQKAFEPIVVKKQDGTEYNIIPSDQFK